MSKTTTTKKASVNFANMDTNVLTMLSNCQLAINELAALEVETDRVRTEGKKAGLAGDDLKKYVEADRKIEKAARDRATTACEVFIIRNMTTADVTSKDFDMYHLDWTGFLRDIGVISAGEVDKKVQDRVKTVMYSAVDRYNDSCAKRKRGERYFTASERKAVKNNVIDLVAAFIAVCIESKAIEPCGGGLAVVDFENK